MFQKKRVLPLFTGSFLVACLIIWTVISGSQTRARDIQYLENPLVADVYVVNFWKVFEDSDSNYKYGVLRVVAVTSEGVECEMSTAIYNLSTGPGDDIGNGAVDADDYYGEGLVWFSFEELQEMKRTSLISRVERRSPH